MASIRPGRYGDLFPGLEQANGISLAETECKAGCTAVILTDHQISVCRNARSFRNGVGILVHIILQHKAGEVQSLGCGVCQLHPVRTSAGVIGLHFIDNHGVDDLVLCSLCRGSKILESAGAVGIAPVGCLFRVAIIGSMLRPAVRIQQIAVPVIQADGIAGADTDGCFKRTFCKGF